MSTRLQHLRSQHDHFPPYFYARTRVHDSNRDDLYRSPSSRCCSGAHACKAQAHRCLSQVYALILTWSTPFIVACRSAPIYPLFGLVSFYVCRPFCGAFCNHLLSYYVGIAIKQYLSCKHGLVWGMAIWTQMSASPRSRSTDARDSSKDLGLLNQQVGNG